jgi:hypothetical protein
MSVFLLLWMEQHVFLAVLLYLRFVLFFVIERSLLFGVLRGQDRGALAEMGLIGSAARV